MPAVNIAPYIYNQYLDDNGDPLAGGFLYTYYAGTSTNKTTYSDGTGTTPNANPIVLDSAGRAPIFLASGAYKFVLKDSLGNTIWTLDYVTANEITTDVATVAALKALSAGSSSIVRTQGYSAANDGGGWWFYWDATSSASDDGGMVIQPNSLPATGRWIGFLPTDGQLDLKTYGAACDGTTDDITELQACDTYCAANNLMILISDNTYFATNPSLSSKVKLLPSCQLRWGNINPTLDVIIDRNDKTQHFNNNATYVPTLNVSELYPEWFGETSVAHPITTATVAALSNQKTKFASQYRFTDSVDMDGGADIESNVDIAGTLDSHGAAHFYSTVQIDGDVTMGAKHISYDGSTTEGLVFPNAANTPIMEGTASNSGDDRNLLLLHDNTAFAQGVGAGIGFYGKYSTNDFICFASIKAYKANATEDNYAGQMHFQTNQNAANCTTFMKADENGGVIIGSPTGSFKGAGTLNAVAVYDDNVLLTGYVLDKFFNPDYSFEEWKTKAPGPAPLFDMRADWIFNIDVYNDFIQSRRMLPTFEDVESTGEIPSTGAMIQKLWEVVEIQSIHIKQLNDRLKALEEVR